MAGSRKFELEIGFDLDMPPHEAKAAAHQRWIAAAARDGAKPVADPVAVVKHDDGLDRIEQFSVIVSGKVVDDGDE